MKKTIFALICALGVLSFTSSENLNNDTNEDSCNLTFTINGGPGCIFNNTYTGYCSIEEWHAFESDVYNNQEGCERPKIKPVVED